MSVDPSLLYLIGDREDPVAVWKLLSEQFQKATWANKLALRRRLHSLRLKEGEGVQDHVKAITEIFNELSVIGDNIQDEDRVIYLLASLPESFDMLVTALEASAKVPEMSTVIDRLLHEEQKIKDRGTSSKPEEGAYMIRHRRKGPRCHHCKKFGHIQRYCPERQREGGGRHKERPKVNATEVESDSENEVGLIVQHALSTGVNRSPETSWIVDSGATCHICNSQNYFVELQILQKPIDITLGDGHILQATGRGTVVLMMRTGQLTRKCKLQDVLLVPKLTYNLLSVSKAVEKGIKIIFNERGCVIKDQNQKLITVADKLGSLYYIRHVESKDHVYTVVRKENDPVSREELWHRRFGHLNEKSLQKLANEKMVEEFDFCTTKHLALCESCLKGKQCRAPFSPSARKAKETLELIHSDVCGKMEAKSLGGKEYFITFIADKTKYCWVYVIKNKSDVFEKFKEWKTEVESLLGHRVRILRTDNGGEYTSVEFEGHRE